MAGLIEQIPKLLAARRQAAAAALANAAAVPASWQILRAVTQQVHNFLRQAVVDGCTFPDRPVYLEAPVRCLLNFGAVPRQPRLDLAGCRADALGQPFPVDAAAAALSPEDGERLGLLLARLAASHADDHRETLVYNLEPWIQEQYRDCLDIDYAEELQRRLDDAKRRMDEVPRQLQSLGLPPPMAREVMAAFNEFRRITAASYQLEREKSSFTDRRGFATVLGHIEEVIARATEALTRAGGVRAQVNLLFVAWKDASYEAMQLTNKLRAVWAGTQLDARIQELSRMLAAVLHAAVHLCPEDAADPRPSCPLILSGEVDDVLDRETVRRAFEAVQGQDVVGASDEAAYQRELRRHGPFCALVVPGTGRVRFAEELRRARQAPEEEESASRKGALPDERAVDVVRRLRYPLNCFVVPHRADAATLERQFVAAWFEYSAGTRAQATKEALEDCRRAVPGVFDPPAGHPSPSAFARERFVDLLAAFVRWTRTGEAPPAALPSGDAFVAWARGRHPRPAMLTPLRYRGPVASFQAMSRRRRDEAWRQYLGPRFALDREVAAMQLVRKDFAAFFAALSFLPPERRENALLERARQEMASADVYGDRDRKVEILLRKFMEEDPDLKTALAAVETRVAIEVEARRAQTESLGKKFNYDVAGAAILQRTLSGLAARRRAVNEHVDRYLCGLLHLVDGNDEAAEETLVECLTHAAARSAKAARPPRADPRTAAFAAPSAAGAHAGAGDEGADDPEPRDEAWFERAFAPPTGAFPKRPVPGVDAAGITEVEYVYFNLGQVYRRRKRWREALMCFEEFRRQAPGREWHWAGEIAREIGDELRPLAFPAAAVAAAKPTTGPVQTV